ncbi:MAG: 2-isopropylmalate synthase [Candidatus Omnitrophica bacterium]|nr:2-isopropylmalate synthase [Candidatus Omnitrophota bacterium]MCM8827340.1 2-isopropylmalate synthase [Candidatus Omnitrophota bacterium]
MAEKVIIFDTTLRDGEQAPGASLTSLQKLEIAFQLEKLGVDVIEAGFPIASPDDFKGVNIISRNIKKSIICALARCLDKDIEVANQSLKPAKHPRIHIFLATSKIHLKYKFKKAEDEIEMIARRATRFARDLCDDIEFSPEDAIRTERDFLFRIIEIAIKEGATTINIPDTVGYSYPQEIFSLITDIFHNVPNINKATVSIHCHDDLGMAVANSLSAVLAGSRQVHCTINGIGERAGNASLEEIVMAIKTRKDVFSSVYTDIETQQIMRTSKLVSALTGFPVPPNKAIVGINAFRHESGIHQDAVIKKRITYEIIDPKDVGIKGSELVLGKHSGRHALIKRLKELGFKLDDKRIEEIFKKFKELGDKKKEIFDDDLIALVEEETRLKKRGYELVSVRVTTGTDITPQAVIKIEHTRKVYEAKSTGDGPVDACYRAIDKIVGKSVKLIDYKLEAITRGKDAQGLVRVEIMVGDKTFIGRGSSTDIIEASIKAYLDALNKSS